MRRARHGPRFVADSPVGHRSQRVPGVVPVVHLMNAFGGVARVNRPGNARWARGRLFEEVRPIIPGTLEPTHYSSSVMAVFLPCILTARGTTQVGSISMRVTVPLTTNDAPA